MIQDEKIIKVLKQHGIVTVSEASEKLNIPVSTIIWRIEHGLPAIKLGAGRRGIWLIRLENLPEWDFRKSVKAVKVTVI